MSQVIIAVIVTGVIVAAITWVVANQHRQKTYEAKIGSAEERSREIIDEALKIAETKKREALLEAKEESLKTKNELEKETKERRAELQRYERRVLSKEENLDKKAEAMEKREAGMNVKEEALKRKTAEAEALYEKGMLELEKISGLTSEQAKEYLLRSVEEDVKHDTAKLIKDLEAKAKEEAEQEDDYIPKAKKKPQTQILERPAEKTPEPIIPSTMPEKEGVAVFTHTVPPITSLQHTDYDTAGENPIDVKDIDWRKAVIASEILNRKY